MPPVRRAQIGRAKTPGVGQVPWKQLGASLLLDRSSARNTFNFITIGAVATSGFEIAKARRPQPVAAAQAARRISECTRQIGMTFLRIVIPLQLFACA
jgi:hypothetical protein